MHGPNAFRSNGAEHAPSHAHACSARTRAVAELHTQKSGDGEASAGQPGAAASSAHLVSKSVEWKRSTHAGASARATTHKDRRSAPPRRPTMATVYRSSLPSGRERSNFSA